MKVEVSLSYAQLCVFDAELPNPYNDWDSDHVKQGFSWRPRSVSFAVEEISGEPVVVEVSVGDAEPQITAASTAIRVPFEVPPSGRVEVGSIMSGAEVGLSPGSYALYFLAPRTGGQPYRILFVPADDPQAAVLQESAVARKAEAYKMNAKAAA